MPPGHGGLHLPGQPPPGAAQAAVLATPMNDSQVCTLAAAVMYRPGDDIRAVARQSVELYAEVRALVNSGVAANIVLAAMATAKALSEAKGGPQA